MLPGIGQDILEGNGSSYKGQCKGLSVVMELLW